MPPTKASASSAGRDGALSIAIAPVAGSKMTKSTNVPPTSTPNLRTPPSGSVSGAVATQLTSAGVDDVVGRDEPAGVVRVRDDAHHAAAAAVVQHGPARNGRAVGLLAAVEGEPAGLRRDQIDQLRHPRPTSSS